MKIKMNNMNISKLYKFKLETKDSKTQKLGISVNQFDSILFRVNIIENKIAKNITDCNVSIIVAKENGELERQTDNIEITNGTQGSIDIYLKNSCVDTVGVCLAQIVITDDNETIRTAKFIYTVNEILDAEIINEATDKVSAVDDLDKRLEELYKQTEENISILNEKIENFGDLFSGDYNDLINKPEIPVVDVDKDYVDTENTIRKLIAEIKSLEAENTKLRSEVRNLKTSLDIAGSNKVTNVDLLKRISDLEKVVYGE